MNLTGGDVRSKFSFPYRTREIRALRTPDAFTACYNFRRGGERVWSSGSRARPLWTGKESRAETKNEGTNSLAGADKGNMKSRQRT
jgi:hypothetical protein